jgi:hypothetical protein
MVAGLTLRNTTYKNNGPKTPNFSMNNPLAKKRTTVTANGKTVMRFNPSTTRRVFKKPSGPGQNNQQRANIPNSPAANAPANVPSAPAANVPSAPAANVPSVPANVPSAPAANAPSPPISEASSMAGAGNLSNAMQSLGSAATGSVKVATKSLDVAVQIADKSVNVGRDTTLKTVETAGVVADVALNVTQKAATSAGEIANVALNTTKNVVAEAGRATKAAAKTAANVTESTGRVASATAKTAAELTETAGLYASGTAKIAAKTALEVEARAGEVSEAAAATTAALSKSALAASEKVGTAAMNASADVTKQSIDVISTTMGSSLALTSNSVNGTINGINNMVTIIGRAGARFNEKISISQNAKDKIQAALGFTEALKHELRAELIKFGKDFKDSLVNFKAVQLEALSIVHTVLKSEYCLGFKGNFKRYFSSMKCPVKSETMNIDALLKQHMQELETKSKMIFSKVEAVLRQFDSSKIALLKLSPSDADTTIDKFKGDMDTMMDGLAKYVTETETLYTNKIDWVQKKLDARTAKVLAELGNNTTGGRRRKTRSKRIRRKHRSRRR